MAFSEIIERNELIRRGDLLQTLRKEKIPVYVDVNYFICNAKPVDAIPLEWVSVNDRLPEPYIPIWDACKAADGRENWVIETVYIRESRTPWGGCSDPRKRHSDGLCVGRKTLARSAEGGMPVEKYISAEAAAEQLRNYKIERDMMVSHNDTIDFAISVISAEVHAADAVSRDCYDRILEENDTMRRMLAQIGKKPGDKMNDVRIALRSEWIINDVGDNTLYAKCKHCLTTQVLYGGKQPTNFCPECGADMREPGR